MARNLTRTRGRKGKRGESSPSQEENEFLDLVIGSFEFHLNISYSETTLKKLVVFSALSLGMWQVKKQNLNCILPLNVLPQVAREFVQTLYVCVPDEAAPCGVPDHSRCDLIGRSDFGCHRSVLGRKALQKRVEVGSREKSTDFSCTWY